MGRRITRPGPQADRAKNRKKQHGGEVAPPRNPHGWMPPAVKGLGRNKKRGR